ncbi:hypothetical protein C8R46DRAFT_1060420 [Mycena filopes]|nr:hypothetical protein C8R46DRAFT_1060420 [Mycena filopes]
MASTKLPVCKACRARKVRCDGKNPCTSCSRARKPTTCEYPPQPPSGSIRPEIAKGAACIECRQKKRKCDGNRPCSTCLSRLQPEACRYRELRADERNLATVIDLEPSGSRSQPTPSPLESRAVSVGRQLAAPDHWTLVRSSVRASGSSPLKSSAISIEPRLPITGSINVALRVSGSSSVHAVLAPQPLDNPRELELSSLRKLFLDNCWDYGLDVTPEKQKAILRGDTSGAVIHPIFIPVAQLMGYLIAADEAAEAICSEEEYSTPSEDEVEQRLRVLNLLDSPTAALDPLTHIQVYKLLAQYCGQRADYEGFRIYLFSASEVALDHDTALGLDDSFTPERSLDNPSDVARDAAEEARAALAHMVYLDMASNVVIKSHPKVHPMIISKFRRFAVKSQEIQMQFVRAKCALLLADSQQLVREWDEREPGTVFGLEWSQRCRDLAHDIQAHLHVLNVALAQLTASSSDNRMRVLTLKSAAIVSLSALAELHAVFAPFHTVPRKKHSEIINAVASISRTFSVEDHLFLDCIIEISWEITSREINQRSPTQQWRLYLQNVVVPTHGPPQLLYHVTDPLVEDEDQSAEAFW